MNAQDIWSAPLSIPNPTAQKNYVDASLILHDYALDEAARLRVYAAFAMTVDAIAPMLAAPLPNTVEPASPYHLPQGLTHDD